MSTPNVTMTEVDNSKIDSEEENKQTEPRVTLTHTVKLSNLPAALRTLFSLPLTDLEMLLEDVKDMKRTLSASSWQENWVANIDEFRQRLLDIDISFSELHNIFSSYHEYKKSVVDQEKKDTSTE